MEPNKTNKTPCPKCGHSLRLGGVQPGEEVCCPKCQSPFTVGGEKGKPAVPPPPRVAAVNPFTDRAPGELPVARPIDARAQAVGDSTSDDPNDDDDAYEPEIPLIPSLIGVPLEVRDAGLGETAEGYRDVDWNVDDDLEAERHSGPEVDPADLHLESARRRGLVRHYRTPPAPRSLFLNGVFDFPWRGLNLGRWVVSSGLISMAGVLAYHAINLMGLLKGDLTQLALPGILVGILAMGSTVLAGMYTVPVWQAAVQDTADGHLLPQEGTLPDWDQWLFMFLGWIMIGASAAALGYPASLYVGPAALLVSFVLLFPVLLLSALEADSYLVPISAPVLRSLGKRAGTWLKFYAVSSVLWLVVGAGIQLAAQSSTTIAWLFAGPALAAAGLIYARLLGRLVWKVSGAEMAPIEIDSNDLEPGSELEMLALNEAAQDGVRPKKKRAGVKIVVPDSKTETLAPESVQRNEPPSGRPRINFHHRN